MLEQHENLVQEQQKKLEQQEEHARTRPRTAGEDKLSRPWRATRQSIQSSTSTSHGSVHQHRVIELNLATLEWKVKKWLDKYSCTDRKSEGVATTRICRVIKSKDGTLTLLRAVHRHRGFLTISKWRLAPSSLSARINRRTQVKPQSPPQVWSYTAEVRLPRG